MTTMYHITDNWYDYEVLVEPRLIRADDETDPRDMIPCIAVTPSIAQCLLAIGDWRAYITGARVYKTDQIGNKADWVFDSHITDEHRIYNPCKFTFVKELDIFKLNEIVPEFPCYGEDDIVLSTMREHLEAIKAGLLQIAGIHT